MLRKPVDSRGGDTLPEESKYEKPKKYDCIAVSVILFLVAIIGTPLFLYVTANRYQDAEGATFAAKLPSHQAQDVSRKLSEEVKVSPVEPLTRPGHRNGRNDLPANVPHVDDPPIVAPRPQTAAQVVKKLDYTPIIVLSTGGGRWNTGVWTGFGPKVSVLNWAAGGVVVDKSSCPFECTFTDDQSRIGEAHAVLMELVNHPKFLGSNTREPIPWPAKRQGLRSVASKDAGLPLFGNFYFEPWTDYPGYTNDPELKQHLDFTVGPDRKTSEIPITLICPWGKQVSDYLNPPPRKELGRMVSFFNEHGIAEQYREYITSFLRIMGDDVHSYNQYSNRPMPLEAGGNPHRLETRMKFVGTYKFVLITEASVLDDWIEPNWSQAFLAGTVPIYIGAPNIREYTPGRKSFIDIREFKSPETLAAKIRELDANMDQYMRYFDWKSSGLSASFQTHLNNCAHYAECRICEWTRRRLIEIETKADAAAEVAAMS